MSEINFGIIGGMGPEATITFMQEILHEVQTRGAVVDQDHPNVIASNRGDIPNRVDYIKWLHAGGEETGLPMPENPIPTIQRSVEDLVNSGCQFGVMPCNTVHYLREEIQEGSSLFILSLLSSTLRHIDQEIPDAKVGLLGTTNTVETGIYSKRAASMGMEVITPQGVQHNSRGEEISTQELVHSAIIGEKTGEKDGVDIRTPDGIKAGNYINGIERAHEGIKSLKEQGANTIILGCTEFPLVIDQVKEKYPHTTTGLTFVDPMQVTAKRVVDIYELAEKKLQGYLENGVSFRDKEKRTNPKEAKSDESVAKYVAKLAFAREIHNASRGGDLGLGGGK